MARPAGATAVRPLQERNRVVKELPDQQMPGRPDPRDIESMTPAERRRLLAHLLEQKRAREPQAFAMSEGQQALWSAYRKNPALTPFNVFLPIRYRSAIDVDALRRAVELVCQRHEMLRTTFAEIDGRLLQRVHPNLVPHFEVHAAERWTDDEIRESVSSEVQKPFDLGSGPMLRLDLYRRGPEDWIVVATTHHIIIDYWSLVLVLQEVQMAYQALRAGARVELPRPVNNYRDFVQQQQEMLAGIEGERLQRFWAKMLEGAEQAVDLPTDFLRPAEFTHRAATCALQIPNVLFGKIKRLAAELHTTPFAIVHSAVQVFLQRYAGTEVFLLGSPAAGRQNPAFSDTVGFFINMLPLRADLTGNPTFDALVRRTSTTIATSLEHEAYPINRIVSDAGVGRDPSRSPLFQFSVTYEKSQVREQAGRVSFLFPRGQQQRRIGGVLQEPFYVPVPTCHYDMEFVFEQTPDALHGMLCYCRDLFDEETVQCMASNFAQLLDSLVHHHALPVATVPWQRTAGGRSPAAGSEPSSVADSRAETAAWKVDARTANAGQANERKTHERTGALPSRDAPQLAAEQRLPTAPAESGMSWDRVDTALATAARQYGSAPALRWRSETLTYDEMLDQATGLAHRLLTTEVEFGSLVPVVGLSRPATLVAIWAVQIAGCVPVPIDARWAAETWPRVMQQVQPSVVLYDRLAETALDCPSIVLHYGDSIRTPPQGLLKQVPRRPDDCAYVIFTSGSTGVPKGVLVSHDAVVNTLRWHTQAAPLGPGDRMLMLLSHQFDAGLGNAWCCLLSGAELVWADDVDRLDPYELIQQIRRDRITVVPAIPSLLQAMAEHPEFRACDAVRMLWTGGEAMPPELPAKVARVTSARFWNFYGPTETAIEASAMEVTGHDPRRPVPIGYPIDGAELRVVDAMRRQVPDTVPGELAIGGRGVAQGYLADPALTEKRFVTLESNSGVHRFYLSGDLCRRNGRGQLEFLGRRDHQVKWRGYRIELTEIEAALQSHAWVERAAVKLVGNDATANLWAFVNLSASPERLVGERHDHVLRTADADPATLACAEGGSPGQFHHADARQQIASILMRFLRAQLPAYKVPTAVAVLDALPLTASGKVDRKQLPDHIDRADAGRVAVAPRTEIERFLLGQWQKALGSHCRSVQQNFFDLGGTSLQAAMLASRLTQELGVNVPTSLLFDALDIADVATQLCTLYPQTMIERFGESTVATQRNLRTAETVDRPAHELIVALKPSGGRPPLFMVHPPGGIVICYRELARSLKADQPLYAIRSRGLHGAEHLPDSLETMAREYVDAIRTVQPRGPYRLGGWSLGGLVAYEVARQFTDSGEAVGQLVLLDTSIPAGATDLVPAEEQVNVGLEYGIDLSLDQLAELPPEQQLPMLWEHAKHLGVLADDSPPEVVNKALRELRDLFHHHLALARGYRMVPLPIPIDLFRPTETPVPLQVSADRGWRHVSPRVSVHFVPGHHHSMVQSPHVQFIARQL
ncbi:MAG: non-ribosomal peptide synthetase [Planctomycetota bacterium]|nr:MAG: non-ribosomal peptide synthetase [Planctomycetota bacterium]